MLLVSDMVTSCSCHTVLHDGRICTRMGDTCESLIAIDLKVGISHLQHLN